jgi:glycine/D-amino acid oxidase-like deaminating enzyme
MSEISSATITAYQETDYRVFGDSPFTLRIREASEPLAELLRQHGTNCAAFITACNPFSRKLDEATNAARQAKLAQELTRRDLSLIAGEGRHPSEGWVEPSYLVLGLSRDEAKKLGRRYEQNAVVWCEADAVPELVLLR